MRSALPPLWPFPPAPDPAFTPVAQVEEWAGPEEWALVVVGFFVVAIVLCAIIAWQHKGRHGR